ncbi:hypothetical protein BUALT_Bualt02G0230500 [Buddleja alternifolia]|uniref:Uncharacterized protein n=1 Tax=Buddleja alternifolia TaxID=168488 RepID=A0AAV6Y405_9LAMI|nr:hypothetical protein BUALT_Bualt02G0230500 [Buddleja alternifolia]
MIVSMAIYQPSLLMFGKNKLAVCADRAAEMGFDESKIVFIHAVQVFAYMTEPTLNRKKDVYRKCGRSESDSSVTFSRHPFCMTLSEKKIMANMDFFVNEVGCKPSDVALCPVLLGLSLDRRMRPRWLVVEMLKSRGLLKNPTGVNSLFKLSEKKYLKKYIFEYRENIPRLLEFYRGTLSKEEIFTGVF